MIEKIKYTLKISPAIPPQDRHKIENVLEKIGYHVWGGGTNTDDSECDITFDK